MTCPRGREVLFWALVAVIGFGIVAIYILIPHGYVIYAVAGLVVFGAYTIFDFNRLRRSGIGSAVPIAAGIFLDVFDLFLFFLELFGGHGTVAALHGRRRPRRRSHTSGGAQ